MGLSRRVPDDCVNHHAYGAIHMYIKIERLVTIGNLGSCYHQGVRQGRIEQRCMNDSRQPAKYTLH